MHIKKFYIEIHIEGIKMEEIRAILAQCLTIDLISGILSNPRQKGGVTKGKIRPMLVKEQLVFQLETFQNNQAFHENLNTEEAEKRILEYMEQFKQLQIMTKTMNYTILISKKGKVTIQKKAVKGETKQINLTHNRSKKYILEEGIKVPFLYDLGVQTADGRIVKSRFDKFRQINRFLEFVEDILPRLDRSKETKIIDFGCGKSYLTFAMYYYLKEVKGYPIRITGLDLKKDVIALCNKLAEKFGFENLTFLHGDIADYEGTDQVDMVVTLHACDTATDYALAKAVRWGAKVILSVPCCQHELNGQIESSLLAPALKYGLIKERMSALLTDAVRAGLLEEAGYRTQILEFIDMEHTPKNILIRAVRQGKPQKQQGLSELIEELHAEPTLLRLLKEQGSLLVQD